jgi:hypothetical protein
MKTILIVLIICIIVVIITLIVVGVLYFKKASDIAVVVPNNTGVPQKVPDMSTTTPIVAPVVVPAPVVNSATIPAVVVPISEKPIPVPTLAPVSTAVSNVVTPTPVVTDFYPGNNGSVSGFTYCKGQWLSEDGKNKNRICTSGKNIDTGASIDCATLGVSGNFGYTCKKTNLYIGDNGSVSGDAYCKGNWGNTPGAGDKNLMCLSGIDDTNKKEVNCTQPLPAGNYSFYCY